MDSAKPTGEIRKCFITARADMGVVFEIRGVLSIRSFDLRFFGEVMVYA